LTGQKACPERSEGSQKALANLNSQTEGGYCKIELLERKFAKKIK
jgi:hypothetical protein